MSQLNRIIKNKKSAKKIGFGLIISGIAFFLLFGNVWRLRNHEIKTDDLIIVEGSLQNELELRHKKSVGNFMTIRLKEYPKVKFNVDRLGIKSMGTRSLINEISMGDLLKVSIMKKRIDHFELKRQKTIDIYSIESDNSSYLNVDDYNKTVKKSRNSISTIVMLGLSLIFIGYGIRLMSNRL